MASSTAGSPLTCFHLTLCDKKHHHIHGDAVIERQSPRRRKERIDLRNSWDFWDCEFCFCFFAMVCWILVFFFFFSVPCCNNSLISFLLFPGLAFPVKQPGFIFMLLRLIGDDYRGGIYCFVVLLGSRDVGGREECKERVRDGGTGRCVEIWIPLVQNGNI